MSKSAECVICGSTSCQHRLCSDYDDAMLGTTMVEDEQVYVYSKDKIIELLVAQGIPNEYDDETGISEAEDFYAHSVAGLNTTVLFVEQIQIGYQ